MNQKRKGFYQVRIKNPLNLQLIWQEVMLDLDTFSPLEKSLTVL